MGFRQPAPDGRKGSDGLPLMILPGGTLLNECYLVSFFAVGGMSIGYKGMKDGREFFVKEVEASESRLVLSLAQEKAMLERLSHPGIVRYIDFFEQDGFYYLITEFVQGQSLNRLISPIPGVFLQEKVVTDWASQLYDIFEYLHRQSPPVIYRDLKPHNIIKDPEGRIHLIDFGIARLFKEDHTSDTSPMGSAITASPEHYGGSQTDERSDIYTLGATLYFLLTNGAYNRSEPFAFAPLRTINPKVSEGLEKTIMKAMALEPKKRLQSVAEMRRAHLGMEKSAAAGALVAGKSALREDAWPGGEEETVTLSRREKSSPSPYVVLALVAITVILFGVGLVNMVKPPGKERAPATRTYQPPPVNRIVEASPVALVTPAPVISTDILSPSPSTTHPPSATPVVIRTRPGKKTPVSAKPPRTLRAPPLATEISYQTSTPGFHHLPVPTPGDGHRPPPHTVFVTVTPGVSATRTRAVDLGAFLDSILPPGYQAVETVKDNKYVYIKSLPGSSSEQWRQIAVIVPPRSGILRLDMAVQGHISMVSGHGRITEKRDLGADDISAAFLYRWFPDDNVPGNYLREFMVKDVICLSLDGKCSFILSGKASPGHFRECEGEFDAFFRRFKENAPLR